MDPRLFDHYQKELRHVREMGAEFAEEFPKVAGRLGLERLACSDPYVERLLEGFAFLAARVQLRIDDSQGQLARHLLEMVYPTLLAPTPSMAIVEFTPSMSEGSLVDGFRLPRGSRMRSRVAADEKTECDFRTAADLMLWPLSVEEVRSLTNTAAIAATGAALTKGVQSGIAVRLRARGGHRIADLPIDQLVLHLSGADGRAERGYERLFRHTVRIAVCDNGAERRSPDAEPELRRAGFDDDEALLPVGTRGFQGYRLLQEYFALPERFHFLKVANLARRIARVEGDSVELVFLLDSRDTDDSQRLAAEHVRLHCVPAINLFPKTADRIHLDRMRHEVHVVADRTAPLDFEVHSVTRVEAHGGTAAQRQRFHPYYSVSERQRDAKAYFSVRREPRLLSSAQKRRGPRASYTGSEVFLALVDENEAPYRSDLRQLGVDTFCTNRDLPLQMPIGGGTTDFSLDTGGPVDSIRCLGRVTVPQPSRAHHRDAWRLVSNLSLNYLSIGATPEDADGQGAAAMLRQMLELHADPRNGGHRRQLDGIVGVRTAPVVRQQHRRSHVEIAHGMQVRLRIDESAFEGQGAYLFGSVMERFFARYASINSFTETVLESIQREEVERWPVRLGTRETS